MILRSVVLTLAVASLVPASVIAQNCVTFTSVPPTASLTMTGSSVQSSGSPATFCSLKPNETYKLFVDRAGFEERRLKFSLTGNNAVTVSGDRSGHVIRSLIVPGWGTVSAGHTGRGIWGFVLTAGGIANSARAYFEYSDEKNDYDSLSKLAEETTDPDLAEQLGAEALASSKATNTKRRYLIDYTVLTGYVWLSNLLETFTLTSTAKVVSIEQTVVTVETPLKSKSRAVVRSALVPGLGQKYLNRNVMGYVYQTAFLAGAVNAIEARNNFNQAVDDLEIAAQQLENATTVEEISAANKRVADARSDAEDKETLRNAWYVVTGAVWAINVLDAIVTGPKAPSEGAGLSTSYNGREFRTEFRVRF